jgi:hypothetical protein
VAYNTGPKLTSGVELEKPITLDVPCPSGTVSGDTFQVGTGGVIAFAQNDRDSDGNCQATIPAFFAQKIPVLGEDGSGDSAVAVGDIICLDGTVVNKDTTNGIEFGMALGTVTSGETENIWVAWVGMPE